MQNGFMEAMQFRHACKVFDEAKKIPEEAMMTILEAGRLSPSSFGIEPWKFLVVTNEELKKRIRPHCWDQVQVTSCSHLVIVLAAIRDAKVEGSVRSRFSRWGMEGQTLDGMVDLYADHLTATLSSDEHIFDWTARQTYIAAANMMTAAAYLQIDSCPIEGFDKAKVEEVLEIDTTQFQLSLVLPFGYRVNAPKPKTRLEFDEVVVAIP